MSKQAHLQMLDDLALLDTARRAVDTYENREGHTEETLLLTELCRRFEPYAFAPDVDPDTDLNFPSNEDTKP